MPIKKDHTGEYQTKSIISGYIIPELDAAAHYMSTLDMSKAVKHCKALQEEMADGETYDSFSTARVLLDHGRPSDIIELLSDSDHLIEVHHGAHIIPLD